MHINQNIHELDNFNKNIYIFFFKKAESGHQPAPAYVQYTLPPNARLLRPMAKLVPSLVARDVTLSARLTPLCASARCQLNLNHTHFAATTWDRESKKLMENTQPEM